MGGKNGYDRGILEVFSLLWGDGFLSPGAERSIRTLCEGLDLRGKRALEFGCGLGGPALLLAEKYGAHVTGIDLKRSFVESARRRARERQLEQQTEFRVVEEGPLDFSDASFDFVLNLGGAFIHTEDKTQIFADCFGVLRSGGTLGSYDWVTSDAGVTEGIRDFGASFGLHMESAKTHKTKLERAGFVDVELTDDSEWYGAEAAHEVERLTGELYEQLCKRLGKAEADEVIAFWTDTTQLCRSGEIRQCFLRARRP